MFVTLTHKTLAHKNTYVPAKGNLARTDGFSRRRQRRLRRLAAS